MVCTSQDNSRKILSTITHTFEDGETQKASYDVSLENFEWPVFEVPTASPYMEDGSFKGAATISYSMDSFDDTTVWGVAYENDDCTGV